MGWEGVGGVGGGGGGGAEVSAWHIMLGQS